MPGQETIRESARDIPVFRRCDVLVVGGGPAGCAAAVSAAQLGADTILVERYGHLGGMSTGGLVLYIERMTDWTGRKVMGGFADEILDRLPRETVLGAPRDAWGSRDPQLVEYWAERESAFHGVVTWSPTIDPEDLKMASNELLLERGVKLLLHSWAVAPVQEGNQLRGVVFESKSGRRAILAKVVVDATGDGDIFALAGAAYESDIEESDIHHMMNVAFRWGGVDVDRYLAFSHDHAEELEGIRARGAEAGVRDRPHLLPRKDVVLFMGSRLSGYSCLDVEDLTAVEIESRRRMMLMLDYYRNNIPGFEGAWVLDTASQMGTRHSRRLSGVKKVSRPEWLQSIVHEDEIGVTPAANPRHPNVSIPYGCLMPATLDNLLAAGRNVSCDAATHVFLRLIPQCWVMGQAAGVAAAMAVESGVRVRDVDVHALQRHLQRQGAYLQQQVAQDSPPIAEPRLPRRE